MSSRRLFAMRLALAMGRPKVDALLDEITEQDFQEWLAFCMIEPFGDEWRQIGLLACMMVNLWSDRKGRPAKPDEFMPLPREQQTQDEMKATIKAMFADMRAAAQQREARQQAAREKRKAKR